MNNEAEPRSESRSSQSAARGAAIVIGGSR
jgi:hypothetical protein